MTDQNYLQGNLFSECLFEQIQMDKADVYYYKNIFNNNESDEILDSLINTIEWEQNYIKLYGKIMPIPRLTAWYGDPGRSYTYSGIEMPPNIWTNTLLKIKNKIEILSNTTFNSVLLNYYRNGSDSVAWHSDNEKELGINPIIGSVSFGTERIFKFRQIDDRKKTKNVILEHGSLLLMKGDTQQYWEHEIAKTKKKINVRVNLTFRSII